MKNEDEKKLTNDFVTRIVFLSKVLIHFLVYRGCIEITKNSEGLYKNNEHWGLYRNNQKF